MCSTTAGDETTAREALADFYELATAAAIPECDRLRRTIKRWDDAVLAYFRSDGLSTPVPKRSMAS